MLSRFQSQSILRGIRKLRNDLLRVPSVDPFKHSPYGKKHGCSTFDDLTAHFRHRQGLEMRIIREVLGDRAAVVPAKAWKTDEIVPEHTARNPQAEE